MIEAKIKKADNKKGYDIDITASGNPVEVAKEITYLVLCIHDDMAGKYGQRAYRHAIQLALAEDSNLWTKEPDDE